ncbi:BTB/POZ domain-containing protein NPY1-like isoform X2 [Cucurbita pepo subsp. pepo]|uniref:BTB/POZ domain-containing protein NPY1-like isoform X1 n=1 Tax=Cucurbita pepo subsp. pepo TaxID=3664 RepID=UPI000C9D8A26|nr:BTB/POZ domain-containing protein NPY1-like isoform X1 [Cucurbita pepo subsp. pepo]XP_023546700.1 BTB/POZ domain-containing protein NPY1-like isoform X2 [Cucurbita pepo subsp. pepo]XP_023546701.1 BTB/POZ domain-containing protein NPY1-like isoform X1 [Cucurbita pepo subsp. pepo]XP_023546702.1 BTB/POZ domain-containing protein NPY1-like isoform X2 [Cucurbita pepo subsp. pepo]XP_023546703.1 BTB/POZ domain-containing protein NPY1-like isoform X1 [Cucurbita pepo subsp. pepo]XP_023546704.1 BTB/P
MKFMKLGSKPDAFLADGKTTRYVSSELPTDVTIFVGEVKFRVHKFPLLSKSNCLQKLVSKANEENSEEIHLIDFPGGPKAFEICAKFCYGITVTLNAYNVVAARCAAEFLEMTEDIEKGNLVFKIEVFLNSSIFRSWKDSIIVLQTSKSLLPWSEDLNIVGRCIDSIASKTSVDPANITWSYTYNRKLAEVDRIVDDGMKGQKKIDCVPNDWWVEDVCELEIDLYRRVMIAVKSKGRMDGSVIGEALKTYAVRWLPDTVNALASDAHIKRNRSLIETIICLLPSDRTTGCSCGFLLKLMKVAILVGADDASREDLVKRISLKLHEASVKDLLILAQSPQITRYDVDLVHRIVNQYFVHHKFNRDSDDIERSEKGADNLLLGHGSSLNVAKLIDEYLAEIADDPSLLLARFIDLSQSIPEFARPIHDRLYKAIDIYLKVHPNLTKADKRKICGLIDVKKLTTEASMHAAQNERLPLRVVVQVLFFEQVRVSAGVEAQNNNNNSRDSSSAMTSIDEECPKELDNSKSLKHNVGHMTINEDIQKTQLAKKSSKNSRSGMKLLPSRSRRIFDKLWIVGKGHGEGRSPETSGSSQSPTSVVPVHMKSSGTYTRQRRHSIS